MVTPLGNVIAGAALVGLALAGLRILTGRVMAASGMVGSLLGGPEGPAAPNIAFIGGILLAPMILGALAFEPAADVEADWPLLVAGGVLVGIGSRLGASGVVGAVWALLLRSGWATAAILMGAGVSLLLTRVLLQGGAA